MIYLMNVPHELEKNVSSVVVGWNSVYTPIRSSWLIVLFRTTYWLYIPTDFLHHCILIPLFFFLEVALEFAICIYPRIECRLCQKILTILQVYESTSLKGIETKVAEWFWKWVESGRPKAKGTAHKPRTLVDKVFFFSFFLQWYSSLKLLLCPVCMQEFNNHVNAWKMPDTRLLTVGSRTSQRNKKRRLFSPHSHRWELTLSLMLVETATYRNI